MHDRSEGRWALQELIFSRHSHHQTLENIAARALAEGENATAFQFADRRCRIAPPPKAHCFVLRAEAAYKLGDHDGALADLATALRISPNDLAALRRLLAWGNDAQREQAASAMILHDQSVGSLRTCAGILINAGRRRLAVASSYDSLISGWVLWDSDKDAEICLSTDDSTLTYLCSPDPFHPLSRDAVRATSFRLPRASCKSPQLLSVSVDGESFFERWLPPNVHDEFRQASKRRKSTSVDLAAETDPSTTPTVIVPVYADYEATRACIRGLINDNPSGKSYRILIVNDATPDPAMARYLASLDDHPHIDVLTNPVNVGFVGSINNALSRIPRGDIVLLNADTLVPPGFVQRLGRAARSSPDIGTVVPLSNNSEISDFPIPHQNNPLGTHLDVIQLDRIMSRCNTGKTVDLPNGTGFCLYITRACLEAVGRLSESFYRGYFEDVDFCLRAREAGFRNVCMPSVFVGHAGSRSFKTEKRALVKRNLDVLDRRFPQLRAESAAFAAADPLRSARQAIEVNLPTRRHRPVLLFAGPGALHHVAESRAAQLSVAGQSVILLDLVAEDGERKIRFRSADGSSPNSLAFPFSNEANLRSLQKYLRLLFPSCCEIIDIAMVPSALLQTFASIKLPFDLWIADGALAGGPARSLANSGGNGRPIGTDPYEPASRDHLVTKARFILATCPMAGQFIRDLLKDRGTEVIVSPSSHRAELRLAEYRQSDIPALVIVPTRASATEFSIIRHIANNMNRSAFDVSIVVAGATLDDQRLLSFDNIFVTGEIAASELARALQPYNTRWLLTGFDQPLFGHPLIETVRSVERPVSYVDFSGASLEARPGDLAIRPELSAGELAEQVCSWIEGS